MNEAHGEGMCGIHICMQLYALSLGAKTKFLWNRFMVVLKARRDLEI